MPDCSPRWLAAVAALLLAGPTAAVAQSEGPAAAPEATTPIAYEARIEGLSKDEDRLRELMRESGISFRLADKPPETVDALRRRARQDLGRFRQIMQSLGFYDGETDFEIREPAEGEPRQLVFTIRPGPVYLIGEVRVQRGTNAQPQPADTKTLEQLDLELGQRAEAEAIIDAEAKLIAEAQEKGHPFARALDRRTVINPERHTMSVTYRIEPGPEAVYGALAIEGADRVDTRHIRNYVLWHQGERYDRRQLEQTRDDLADTNLFRSVSITPVEPLREDGEVPIQITVEERPPRSIGFGVNYATDIGPGGEAFWEHRNFSGQGERVRVAITGSAVEQGVEGLFRKPLFLDREQALVAEGELKNQITDAFEEQRGTAFVGVERDLGDDWSISVGPVLEYFRVEEAASARGSFVLGGLRGGFRRSTVEDPLNPTQGTKLDFVATPYTSLDDNGLLFLKTSVTGSAYWAVDEAERYVLAGRARYGNIVGADRNELPAGIRFYAGGGGSVRGYEFQSVGPLDAAGDPIGGRSTVEFGAEFRARITENIGIVPFVDAGNVYRKNVPENLDLLWAVGLGLRYHTAVGPIRADIAIPIDRRDVDDSFQFYFSLGQAF